MAGQAITNFLWKEHNEAAQAMVVVYRDAGRIRRKTGIIFWQKFMVNKFL
jgi:hypothetical protein